MGYTHYWTFRSPAKGEASSIEAAYIKALAECTKVVKAYQKNALDYERLSGYTAHAKNGQYGGLHVNGKQSEACEDFTMREHYKQNLERSSEFCKTNRRAYDMVVVACLIILKHRLGDLIDIGSDGDVDDWTMGLELAKRVLRLKTLKTPATIRQRRDAA